MELPSALQKKIVEFLTALSPIHDANGQQALLVNAGLDAPLRNLFL